MDKHSYPQNAHAPLGGPLKCGAGARGGLESSGVYINVNYPLERGGGGPDRLGITRKQLECG